MTSTRPSTGTDQPRIATWDSNLLKLTGCWESTTKGGKRMLKGAKDHATKTIKCALEGA